MRIRILLLVIIAVFAVTSFEIAPNILRAQTQASVALTGQVTSAEEGPMEGVLVSAKKDGSTITITVVSDEHGLYRFPSAKLQPGRYSLRIRAVGYDLNSPLTVEISTGKTVTADLKLSKAQDLASHLSNTEWLASFPGTEQQKASIRACTHCHTLERIARTRFDVDKFISVIERMSGYPQLSFPFKIQKLLAPRIGGGRSRRLRLRAAGAVPRRCAASIPDERRCRT